MLITPKMEEIDAVHQTLKTSVSNFNLPVEVPEELIKTNPQFKSLLKKLEERMTPTGLSYKTKNELEEAKNEMQRASKEALLWKTFTELMMTDDALPEEDKQAFGRAAVLQIVPKEAEDEGVTGMRHKLKQLPQETRDRISKAAKERVEQVYSDACAKLRVDGQHPAALSSAVEQKLKTYEQLKERVEREKSDHLTMMARIQQACHRCIELAETRTELNQQLHTCEVNKFEELLKEIEVINGSFMLSIGELQQKVYSDDAIAATKVIDEKLKAIEEDVDQQILIKKHQLALYENLGEEIKELAEQYAQDKRLREHWKKARGRE